MLNESYFNKQKVFRQSYLMFSMMDKNSDRKITGVEFVKSSQWLILSGLLTVREKSCSVNSRDFSSGGVLHATQLTVGTKNHDASISSTRQRESFFFVHIAKKKPKTPAEEGTPAVPPVTSSQ